MPERFANLGTVAVLDAHLLSVGRYSEIDGKIFVVEKIEDQNVYFRPVIGWELWRYRWSSMSILNKIFLVATILGFIISVWYLVVLWYT